MKFRPCLLAVLVLATASFAQAPPPHGAGVAGNFVAGLGAAVRVARDDDGQ